MECLTGRVTTGSSGGVKSRLQYVLLLLLRSQARRGGPCPARLDFNNRGMEVHSNVPAAEGPNVVVGRLTLIQRALQVLTQKVYGLIMRLWRNNSSIDALKFTKNIITDIDAPTLCDAHRVSISEPRPGGMRQAACGRPRPHRQASRRLPDSLVRRLMLRLQPSYRLIRIGFTFFVTERRVHCVRDDCRTVPGAK